MCCITLCRVKSCAFDAPWEGSGCGYHSIFKDDDKYRMYYKAYNLDVQQGGKLGPNTSNFTCYAESDDGIHWKRLDLGLFDFAKIGSKNNNIVISTARQHWMKDSKPDPVHPRRLYGTKTPLGLLMRNTRRHILRSEDPQGLLVLKSADGIHWSLLADQPVIKDGVFDSQNLAFWDPTIKKYRAYWRYFTEGNADNSWKVAGYRDIRTATSDDLIHWDKSQNLTYGDAPPEHLYTNQIKPYYRAPHILVGFPSRYIERGWTKSMNALPEFKHRKTRSSIDNRYGMAITEGLFMTSRDGINFKRWQEAFLRPGIERNGTWAYGNQYIAWQMVETKSTTKDAPNEISLYASENYWTGKSNQLRRYTMRIDGFVSVNAPMKGGEIVTKPLIFSGKELLLNFSSSAAGSIVVELQTPDGKPIPGFTEKDCSEIFGDSLSRPVHWKNDPHLSQLVGKPIRIKIKLKDADLYSLQFK